MVEVQTWDHLRAEGRSILISEIGWGALAGLGSGWAGFCEVRCDKDGHMTYYHWEALHLEEEGEGWTNNDEVKVRGVRRDNEF